MDLRQLSYFVSTYEEGSVTAAARRCHVSQPSVSAAIAGLESQLGIQAFERHKKGVRPTPAGERLYVGARRLLDEAAALEAHFVARKPRQPLRLGLMEALDARRVAALLAPLLRAEPTLDLRLTREAEPCDARIVCEGAKRPEEAFQVLWTESFALAVPRHHPLAVKPEVLVGDLDGVALIARDYCSNLFTQGSHQLGVELNVVATAFSEEWAVSLVEAGVGVAIVPMGCLSPTRDLVVRHFANIDARREVGVAYHPRTLDERVGPMLSQLLRSFADDRAA